MAESTLVYHDAHNQYLDTLVKKGLFGLVSLLVLFAVPLFAFWHTTSRPTLLTQSVRLLGVITIVSVMTFCLTQSFLAHHSGLMFYLFLVTLFYATFLRIQENTSSNNL